MRRALLSLFLMAVVPAMAASAQAAPAARQPVVIELYTAQGCSSCRKANEHLAELAEKPGVLALTFAVDYWDYLGWPDSFAQPAFADRQKAYARKLNVREVYTPQVVVDGRSQTGGVKLEKIEALVAEAARTPVNPPDMLFLRNGRIAVGSGPVPRGGAEVWIVRYDPRELTITPKRGDNRGVPVVHRNVVRQLAKLGAWSGSPTAYRTPKPSEDGLKTVILVQAARGGKIIGVLVES
jgi:hypothetical protein